MVQILREVEPYISPKWQKQKRVECKCDCWNIFETQLHHVKWWHTKSCWCYQKKKVLEHNSTHCMSDTRIYNIWRWMKRRCTNKNDGRYKDYWWRWIWYSKEWGKFEWFFADMWQTYEKWLTLERINNNWNYCKENCYWATMEQQQKNRRNNIYYKWKLVKDWCRELWLNYWTVYSRISRNKWAIEKALWL